MPEIDAANDLTSVLELSREMCLELGVLRQSYHFSPIFSEPNSIRTVVHARGFSDDWLKLYEQSGFRHDDPIPERAYERGNLLTWDDAMTQWPNTTEQEQYFAAMREHGLVHGFGMPLFGPRGRTAYASFDFGVPLSEVAPESLSLVRMLAPSAHQRLCNLIDQTRNAADLSAREREVLMWMAKGKSSPDIAGILEVSPETVKTYRDRVYQKLGVNDRIGAVIRALKLGLIVV